MDIIPTTTECNVEGRGAQGREGWGGRHRRCKHAMVAGSSSRVASRVNLPLSWTARVG